MTHLKDYDHPYYCHDGNYYHNDSVTYWDSWSDFFEEFGDADKDYNLIFRWDWKVPDPDDYDTEGWYGDPEEVPTYQRLHLYYMMQRKGRYDVNIVDVTDNDEPAVREFLSGYAEHMKKIWEPLL